MLFTTASLGYRRAAGIKTVQFCTLSSPCFHRRRGCFCGIGSTVVAQVVIGLVVLTNSFVRTSSLQPPVASNVTQLLPDGLTNKTRKAIEKEELSTTVTEAPRYVNPKQDNIQLGCQELRSKRYISDGFCTSIKPITEMVCSGHCLPIQNLPWYAEFVKVWAQTKVLEWRCVDDQVRRRKVTLMCENGDTHSYTIRVVRSCKCKRYVRFQNQSGHAPNGRRHKTESTSSPRNKKGKTTTSHSPGNP